jgi:hypothetical protein
MTTGGDLLHEWVDGGAQSNVKHMRLHVEMAQHARTMRSLAFVLIVLTLVNLAATVVQLLLRFGAVSQ